MKTKIVAMFTLAALTFTSCEKEQAPAPLATFSAAQQKDVSQVIKEANPTLWAQLVAKQDNPNARVKEDVLVFRGIPHVHPDYSYCCIKLGKGICLIEIMGEALTESPSDFVAGVDNGTIAHLEADAEMINTTNSSTVPRWLIINAETGAKCQRISHITATNESDRLNIEYVPY